MLGKKLGKSEQPWPLAPYYLDESTSPNLVDVSDYDSSRAICIFTSVYFVIVVIVFAAHWSEGAEAWKERKSS